MLNSLSCVPALRSWIINLSSSFLCCDIDRFVVAYLELCAPYGLNNRENLWKMSREFFSLWSLPEALNCISDYTWAIISLFFIQFSSAIFFPSRPTWPNAGSTVLLARFYFLLLVLVHFWALLWSFTTRTRQQSRLINGREFSTYFFFLFCIFFLLLFPFRRPSLIIFHGTALKHVRFSLVFIIHRHDAKRSSAQFSCLDELHSLLSSCY